MLPGFQWVHPLVANFRSGQEGSDACCAYIYVCLIRSRLIWMWHDVSHMSGRVRSQNSSTRVHFQAICITKLYPLRLLERECTTEEPSQLLTIPIPEICNKAGRYPGVMLTTTLGKQGQHQVTTTHQSMSLQSMSCSSHLAVFMYTFISLHLSGCHIMLAELVHNVDGFMFLWVKGDHIFCDLWANTSSRPIRLDIMY